jgi:hypothetical protein
MAVEQTLAQEPTTDVATEAVENQAATKTYTQEEVDNMMARMRGSLEKKLLKPYQELGDVNELRSLREQEEQRQQEEALKRGEWQQTLKDLAAKKDAEIQKRDTLIKEYKVNGPLLEAASKYKSINAAQVRQLLTNQVRLSDNGDDVEVLDAQGNVRYNDSGELVTVDALVQEFLQDNPHFVQAGVSTSNSKTSMGTEVKEKALDLASLDMTNPADRKIYKEAKAKGLL